MGKSCMLEMAKRRRDMLRYSRLGLPAKDFCGRVASKYGVSEEAVLRDWAKRKEWMKSLCAEEKNRSLALEMVLEYESDLEQISSLIEKEQDATKLIQLYHLKEKLRSNMKEFLFKLGAFDSVKFDLERQIAEKARKLFEKTYPWVKGNRKIYNSAMALEKYRGKLSIAELMEFEAMFNSYFLGKNRVKPSVTLALTRMRTQNHNQYSKQYFRKA